MARAGQMRRLIFINRFFFPDQSATSQLLSDLAFHLAECGKQVQVIASQQMYGDPQACLPTREIVRGVHIHRVPTTRFGRSALLGRGVDYLSFYAASWRALLATAGDGDIIVAKTDPPLVSIVAMQAAKRRGALLVNWLQDVYPEIAVRAEVPFLKGPIVHGLTWLRNRSLQAVANVVVGNRMAELLRAQVGCPDRISVVPNWSDDEKILPIHHADNPLRREWALEDKFVVGYSGNLGRAHEFDTVLNAAERFRNDEHIIFLLIGGGSQVAALARGVKNRGLDRIFRFVRYQERMSLKYSLGVSDVHWISLKPDVEGLIFPSKFYGIAAASRPIIAIAARNGEIGRLVQQHACGFVVEPGDAEALAEALVILAADAERGAEMGRRARAMLEAGFTRRQAFERWRAVLADIA
jgi:glycosyltransferase involved in cell wall biosynthesis